MPVSMKNILLAKTQDSESTTAALTTLRDWRALSSREQCVERESKKKLRHKRFLQSQQVSMQTARAFLAS